MTKFKKTFLTITSAFCCVLCSALAIFGLVPKKTVLAENASEYETATVYDVSQLSANGPTGIVGDTKTDWFTGKTSAATYEPFNYNNKGYAAIAQDADTYALKSLGITFNLKVDSKWTATCSSAIRFFICNTEVRWNYNATNGFKLEVFDWNDASVKNRAERVNPKDTDVYIDDFDETENHTYKIVKSLKTSDASSYKLDLYIDGIHEYTALFSNIVPKQKDSWAIDQLRLYNNNGNPSSITVFSSHTLTGANQAKDVYDYQAKDEFLSGKAFESTYDETAGKATKNADVFDYTGVTDVSADSFGVTFKAKFDTDVVAGREVLRARIGSTYDVRLSVVTAGVNGRAQINAFDWQSQGATNKILGDAAYQFDIDLTEEHTYSFIKEKIEGTTSGYVYSAYVDGVLIQRAIYNVAPAASWGGSNDYNKTNRMRIMVMDGNYTGTFRSAKYYGVKIDGEMNKVNVGESYTLTAPNTDKLFFGYKATNGDIYQADDTLNEYTELTSMVLKAYNGDGAAVRFLHAESSSLKWVTYIDKTDLEKLQQQGFTVSVYREVTTAEDATKKIYEEVVISEMAVNTAGTEYTFAQILSNIKANHFDWVFDYNAYVEIKDAQGNTIGKAQVYEKEGNARSIAYVAEKAYNDIMSKEELAASALTEEEKALYKYELADGRLTRYSQTQRNILEKYFQNTSGTTED